MCASDDIPWLVRVPVQRLLLRFHFSLRNSFTGNCTFNEIVKDVVIGIDLPMWPNKKKEDSPTLVTKRHVEKKINKTRRLALKKKKPRSRASNNRRLNMF